MLDKNSSPEPSMDQILATIRRILAEDAGSVTRPVPPPRNRANGDVLDLTEAIGDDGTVRHIAPFALVMPEAPAAPALPDGRIEPVPPRSAGAETAPRLVSDTAVGCGGGVVRAPRQHAAR